MIRSRLSTILFVSLVSVSIAPSALAGPIYSAVSATTNMGVSPPFPCCNLENIINESGLRNSTDNFPNYYTSGVTDFDTYIASNPRHVSVLENDWISLTPTGFVDFNLGSVLSIGRMAVWTFGGNLALDITQVHLFGSLDAAFLTPVDLGSFSLAVTTCVDVSPTTTVCTVPGVQTLGFPSTSAQYIRMQVVANNGGGASALGEVAFAGAAVPEPGSFSLVFFAAFVLCLGGVLLKGAGFMRSS